MDPGWHFGPVFSPDGKKLAWTDEKLRLVVDGCGDRRRRTVADTGEWETTQYAWSPDSRYLAYSVPLANEFNQVRIWDSQTKSVHPVTDPTVNSFSPAWDPKGKYLSFLRRAVRQSVPRPLGGALHRQRGDAALRRRAAGRRDATLRAARRHGPEDPTRRRTPRKTKRKRATVPIRTRTRPPRRNPRRSFRSASTSTGIADRIVQVPVAPGQLRRPLGRQRKAPLGLLPRTAG